MIWPDEFDACYDAGFIEGRAVEALRHGIAEEDLWVHSATYHAAVTTFIRLMCSAKISGRILAMFTGGPCLNVDVCGEHRPYRNLCALPAGHSGPHVNGPYTWENRSRG